MRRLCASLVPALAAVLIASAAQAELLSPRPISVIIPFTPGASADTLQRIVARKVTEDTGQVLVVESRPGGGGVIAAAAVKQAQPDGHTLLQANSATHADGKVRAIAVTSPERLPALPQAPTMREAGFDGIALDAWFGLVAPAGTPEPVIAKLNSAFVAAIKHPDVVRQIAEQGAEPRAGTPGEFASFIASETERIGGIVRAVGVKAE